MHNTLKRKESRSTSSLRPFEKVIFGTHSAPVLYKRETARWRVSRSLTICLYNRVTFLNIKGLRALMGIFSRRETNALNGKSNGTGIANVNSQFAKIDYSSSGSDAGTDSRTLLTSAGRIIRPDRRQAGCLSVYP